MLSERRGRDVGWTKGRTVFLVSGTFGRKYSMIDERRGVSTTKASPKHMTKRATMSIVMLTLENNIDYRVVLV